MFAAAISTSAGFERLMRPWISWKSGSPRSLMATISPSNTAEVTPCAFSPSTTSGYCSVTWLPRRLRSSTSSPRTNASARTPSSFGSNSQPGRENGRSMSVASIGRSERADGKSASRAAGCGAAPSVDAAMRGMRPSFRSWIVTPLMTERSSSSTSRVEANSSRCLISSQSFGLRAVRTSVHEPRSFLPRSVNEILPASIPSFMRALPVSRSPHESTPSSSGV